MKAQIYKPLKVKPIEAQMLMPERIFEKGDAPPVTPAKLRKFRENYKQITPPAVNTQLKKHRESTMHGAYSVNQQVTEEFQRPTSDIDVWTKTPKQRAIELENALDKKAGCDIAHVEEKHIGPAPSRMITPGPPKKKPKTSHERYVVVTQPQDDLDVDYTTYPDRNYKKRLFKGIYHETLESAHQRALELSKNPRRTFKSLRDARRIEAYLATKSKKK